MENKGLIIGLSVLGLGTATFFGWRAYRRKKMGKAYNAYDNTLSSGNKVSDVATKFRNAETEDEKLKILSNAVGVAYTTDDIKKLSANSEIGNYEWKDKNLRDRASKYLTI